MLLILWCGLLSKSISSTSTSESLFAPTRPSCKINTLFIIIQYWVKKKTLIIILIKKKHQWI